MRLTFRVLSFASVVVSSAAVLAGCTHESSGQEPRKISNVSAIYALPASLDELSQETFFDHPWPSDLRLEGGAPRFTGYPNPYDSLLLEQYIEATTEVLDGFSPAAPGYVRFTGPIADVTLPASPREALDPAASVQLIDIDPASPEHLQRKLISLRWQGPKGVYYRENTLAFMPTIGFPLRPSTRYAFVVTNKLQTTAGEPMAQQEDLAKVLGVQAVDDKTRAASAALAPAVSEIKSAGIDPKAIVHLAVFTTADPTKELQLVRDAVASLVPAPTPDPTLWKKIIHKSNYDEYRGRYGPSPNFQVGALPFALYGDGGGFVFANGMPVLTDTFTLRFALVTPNNLKCPMPPSGYPIVLYAHGTGGDYRSYIDDGTAERLALACLASMGIDQIFHGDRPGAPPPDQGIQTSTLFFNFQNPIAARTNGRQAAVDEVQRARLFTESHLTIPANISFIGQEITFDASKLMYFGHSQGGLNGPLFTAVDPSVRGAVFSGSGAQIGIALLEKTLPAPDVSALVKTVLLGLHADDEGELDIFHPALSLAQSLINAVDPLHYGRLQQQEPRAGFAPKSIYMTEGVNPDGVGDSYAPPHGIEAHGLVTGLPLQLPSQHPIVEAQWGGPPTVTIAPEGLTGNLGGGLASGVLAQWPVPPDDDGHFVVFLIPGAKAQSIAFLRNLAANPVGLVPPP